MDQMNDINSRTFLQKYENIHPQRTSYNAMNEWMRMKDRQNEMNVAPTVNLNNWRQDDRQRQEQPPVRAYSASYDMKYQKAYQELAKKIAYRYPDPGQPRVRQGRIGSSWRHIKEVLGHTGARVCFVDGLVSLYDNERFNEKLSGPLPIRANIATPLYAPNRSDFSSHGRRLEYERERRGFKPWESTTQQLPKKRQNSTLLPVKPNNFSVPKYTTTVQH